MSSAPTLKANPKFGLDVNIIVPSIIAGTIAGLLAVFISISFAALIFSGSLNSFVAAGIGAFLIGTLVMCLVMAIFSSAPGMIALPQDSSAAIIALIGTTIIGKAVIQSPTAGFATLMAVIVITSVVTGLIFYFLGRFELGRLVRYVPFPVVGGFLAGTGLLLVQGGVGIMAEAPLTISNVPLLMQPEQLARWLPGMVFAVVLIVAMRRIPKAGTLATALLASLTLFYVVLFASGSNLQDALAGGWLIGPFEEGALWRTWSFDLIGKVQWGALVGELGNMATVTLIGIFGLLLNASGLELTMRRDINLNKELEASGISNVLAGLAGSMAGYQALSLSSIGPRMGIQSRMISVVAALVSLVALVFGATVLSVFPRVVVGGLIVFLGFAFLVEWLIDSRHTLPRADYALVLIIMIGIAAIGFLEGVLLGILIAVILFVVKYGSLDVVKTELDGTNLRSAVDRSPAQQQILRAHGAAFLALRLQGFIFFGTADGLVDRIRARIQDANLPALRSIVLDFHLVSGMDTSAYNSFAKLKHLAQTHHFGILLSNLSPDLKQQFLRAGIGTEQDSVVRFVPDLDHGIELCENEILAAEGAHITLSDERFTVRLLEACYTQDVYAALMSYFEHEEVQAGYTLIEEGDDADAMYLIESGEVTVLITASLGRNVRVARMGPGTIVGELGLYLGQPRTARVITDVPTSFYRLRATELQRMQTDDPAAAAVLANFLVRNMAERLVMTTALVKDVLG